MISIIIIGGGPAGLALAAGLSNFSTNDITIIEKTNYDNIFSGEHLQAQILPIFEQLNIPKEILYENSTHCAGRLGNWAGHSILSQSIFNPFGQDFIVHRPAFEQVLADYLRTKGVNFFLGNSLRKIENGKIMIGSEVLRYDYLFDCSGRTSRKFDNQRIVFDNLVGISFYDPDGPTDTAKVVIESVKNGWWYQTSNEKMSITTFFTDTDIYQNLSRELQKEIDKTKVIKNYCRSLKGEPKHNSAYTSILKNSPTGIYQLGDSYFSLDPLSSQGIFKAFSQALQITDVFSKTGVVKTMSEFYMEQKKEFFRNLKLREYFYYQGWQKYNSEFYKRRIELGMLKLSAKKQKIKNRKSIPLSR
jgi:flavin-dependent dehydrogenase